MKHLFLFLFGIIVITNLSYSQNFPAGKNAVWLSGLASYSNHSGEIYEDSKGNSYSSITLSPSINYFVSNKFFIGGNLRLTHQYQGSIDASSVSIGPLIGLELANQQSSVFPYLSVGLSYKELTYSSSSVSGSDLNLGFGIMMQAASHLGIAVEFGYHMVTLESHSGSEVEIGVGVAGLFY